ncbi:hypothetical protein Poli38472_004493 [Pythium oligandrum]|uniref:Fcf2 pre-rRNA processing C-terminal domain-containing protein n=1 Tax=Pythium oligandrum TaxID=41045 RepID=A0A8K1C9X8_PYTOL|nr:hypothetical protein Poli38472_004493 [Pythium oligandrum]|eukprot:TMW59424.1 hypothetical protein Poli38472_004493 [Pythium oligandrum]
MWGILTNMVATRRSSARLQGKQEAAVASTESTPTKTEVSPGRSRRSTPNSGSKTKKSPVSSGKRSRTRKEDAESVSSATESDQASEEVTKQLFSVEEATTDEDPAQIPANVEKYEQPAAVETEEETEEEIVVETVVEETVVEKTVVVETVVEETVVEPEADPETEEEEIVMMNESEDESAEEIALGEEDDEQTASANEDELDEEVDVLAFAKMAASGISLSTSKTTTASTGASTSSIRLVPDALDSGASARTKFLEFDGSKLAQGAKLVEDTVAVEERKGLAMQLNRVAKANRQRDEATATKSAGRQWFGMASHEMSDDVRRDFALLRMRNYLDPKKFYKSSDHGKKLPKHFQLGTVIEGAHEFKSARLSKKERQQTFTDEIMADEDIRKYTKRVYGQIQQRTHRGGKKKRKMNTARF